MATTHTRPATEVMGRYLTPHGARTLYARRTGETTYISDEPAQPGKGDIYAIDAIPMAAAFAKDREVAA